MISIRKSGERGHFDHGWLDTFHTFSFSDYYDPDCMSFRSLRVINEDRVEPGRGFGTHGHNDMEILTYILEGGLQHRDNIGNGSVIRPGDVQRMSAGTGVLHSEVNASATDPVHLLQIWLLPERSGLSPGYEEKHFPVDERRGQLRLIASREGRDGSVTIFQDASIYAAVLDGTPLDHHLLPNRHAWVQVAGGAVSLNDIALDAGDGAAISDEKELRIQGELGELLLFDLG